MLAENPLPLIVKEIRDRKSVDSLPDSVLEINQRYIGIVEKIGLRSLNLAIVYVQGNLPENWLKIQENGGVENEKMWIKAFDNSDSECKNIALIFDSDPRKLLKEVSWLITSDAVIANEINKNIDHPDSHKSVNELKKVLSDTNAIYGTVMDLQTSVCHETCTVFGLSDTDFNQLYRSFLKSLPENVNNNLNDQNMWQKAMNVFVLISKSNFFLHVKDDACVKDLFCRLTWMLAAKDVKQKIAKKVIDDSNEQPVPLGFAVEQSVFFRDEDDCKL